MTRGKRKQMDAQSGLLFLIAGSEDIGPATTPPTHNRMFHVTTLQNIRKDWNLKCSMILFEEKI